MKRKSGRAGRLAACVTLLLCACASGLIAHSYAPLPRAASRVRPAGRSFARLAEATPGVHARDFARDGARGNALTSFDARMTFEPSSDNASGAQFIARGRGMAALLTGEGILIKVRNRSSRGNATSARERVRALYIRVAETGHGRHVSARHIVWQGRARLPGVSNYLIGRDPREWRLRVPRFAAVESANALPHAGIVAYGNDQGIEYDLRIAPGADAAKLRLLLDGARNPRIHRGGDLLLDVGDARLRMAKPRIYEESAAQNRRPESRRPVAGGYVLHADGSIGFRVGPHDRSATLVIDPTVSLAYATFLGGAGADSANGVAVDSTGDVYVGGTTTSPGTFTESPAQSLGSSGTGPVFFVAKLDPAQSGANSLRYLTFIGGNGTQSGGEIAVDAFGNAVIAGTTTSTNYPVTDGSALTPGTNDAVITELGVSGAQIRFSTLLGGNGAESTRNPGGVALDSSGRIFLASDTTSTDLPVTSGAFQQTYGGGLNDGFLAIFQPTASPALQYCSYLGIDAQVAVGGLTVDSGGKAYIAGYTSDPQTSFPATPGALQGTYQGGDSDAFLMKMIPAGKGASDLEYATLLGGGGADQALAVAVDSNAPPNAYVTGSTTSGNFPLSSGANAPYQSALLGQASAFLSVIAEDPATQGTRLAYSTYLGGSQSDQGRAIAIVPPAAGSATPSSAVYVAGAATSWDFPWHDNLQPFNGDTDAFVAKLDPSGSGGASLIYATPMGGAAAPGVTSTSQANTIALDADGNPVLAGATTAAVFPLTANPGNGAQAVCGSCQESTPLSDAFLVKLAESGAAEAAIRFSTAKVRFGSQEAQGGAGQLLPVAMFNTGDAALAISAVQVTGPNASDFSLPLDGCASAQVQPGSACSFEVTFAPTQVGTEGAFVTFQDNAAGNPQVLALEGTGTGALAAASPNSVDFGSVPENVASPTETVTLQNAGTETLTITSTAISGPDAAEFTAGQGSTCLTQTSLPAGSSCVFEMSFESGAAGTFHAEIDITDNSDRTPGAQQVIPLTGTAILPAPVAVVAPASLSFGVQTAGSSSGPQTVTLANTGSAPLVLSGISISGSNAGDFTTSSEGATPCPPQGGTVAVGDNCSIAVRFAPASAGAKAATLSFSDNAEGSPHTVSLNGTAVAPAIQVTPASLSYAVQSVGTSSAAQTIMITDTGSSALAVNGVAIGGADAADFTQGNNCPPSLPVNASCVVNVTFKPAAPGTRTAQISISSDAASSPQNVPLSGVGIQTAASVAPSSVGFGGQMLNTPGSPFAVTLTNTGSASLAVSGISFAGADAADFSETDNCTSNVMLNIQAGASCTIEVSFEPLASGSLAASLVVADNAPGSPQIVALSGTGMDFNVTDPPESGTSLTIAAGQTAFYPLEVNSLYGFTGSVSLACSGAPPEGACTVNPPSVNVAANASAQFQVSVTSTAASGALPPRSPRQPPPARLREFVWILLLMILPPLLIGTGSRRKPRDRFAGALAISTLLLFGMAGCGGSHSTPPPGNPGTPAGAYPLVITATAGNVRRTIALTLKVN